MRALDIGQVREIYNERMTRDFPRDELKPLSRIKRALEKGEYAC